MRGEEEKRRGRLQKGCTDVAHSVHTGTYGLANAVRETAKKTQGGRRRRRRKKGRTKQDEGKAGQWKTDKGEEEEKEKEEEDTKG